LDAVIYRFHDLTLDTESLELRHGDKIVPVEPQVFRLLTHLVEKRSRVVSKDELIEVIWDGRAISDGALNSRINAARRAVGDSGDKQAIIKTFPRRGFRFVSSVTVHADADIANNVAGPFADKPSIAILPFDNLSGDVEQEYFADGVVEDVITGLSRFRSLFVIARNSSFTYKGTSTDVRQVARELGVRYVVEGSVRRAGSRVRITAQLIDAKTGGHLWADRFDGTLDDVFCLQDQITEQIVVAIEPEVQARESERVRRNAPESLDAWELTQRGLSHLVRINKADREQATHLFRQAILLEPEFAAPHAHLALALCNSVFQGFAENKAEAVASMREAAERAVSLDRNDANSHYVLGHVHAMAGDIETAINKMQTAIEVNPNSARGYYGLGWAYHFGAGQAEQALPHYDAAQRLSPRDPLRWMPLMLKGSALRLLGRHEEAITSCRQACQIPDSGFLPHMHLAAALAEAGRQDEAEMALNNAKQLELSLSISFIRNQFIQMHETTLNSLLASLRKAGVPE
jgi:TolB-like protein/tetratricopeptide (TPR) repeat protein